MSSVPAVLSSPKLFFSCKKLEYCTHCLAFFYEFIRLMIKKFAFNNNTIGNTTYISKIKKSFIYKFSVQLVYLNDWEQERVQGLQHLLWSSLQLFGTATTTAPCFTSRTPWHLSASTIVFAPP